VDSDKVPRHGRWAPRGRVNGRVDRGAHVPENYMYLDAEQGHEIDWLEASSRRTAGGVLVTGGGGSSRDGQGRPSVSAGGGDDLDHVHSDDSDSVMGSNLVLGQPGASMMAAQERGSVVEGNRGCGARGCGAGSSGCQASLHRIALAIVISIVLAVPTPSNAMGAPSALHHDDWASMLPESVSAESALGGEMLRHWMSRHAVMLDNHDGVKQVSLERRPVTISISHEHMSRPPFCIISAHLHLPNPKPKLEALEPGSLKMRSTPHSLDSGNVGPLIWEAENYCRWEAENCYRQHR